MVFSGAVTTESRAVIVGVEDVLVCRCLVLLGLALERHAIILRRGDSCKLSLEEWSSTLWSLDSWSRENQASTARSERSWGKVEVAGIGVRS